LVAGSDFRLAQYREEVFQRFFSFHLKYKSNPGCVYYLMPDLAKHNNWDAEQQAWFAFINGNTQNPITSWLIMQRAPTINQFDKAIEFWNKEYSRLSWDTDRRYNKKSFDAAITDYVSKTKMRQVDWWSKPQSWGGMWEQVSSLHTFGRLSTWSYIEYGYIMGLHKQDADSLMLNDISGSRSHRNGLAIVLGHEQYDWHKSNPDFDGNYSPDLITKLEAAGASLLAEMKERAKGKEWEHDVSYFTLESTLCTYKSWHRPNRRYPNVYNDMMSNRIKKAEAVWGKAETKVFWEAREWALPEHLRIEDNPEDLGLHPVKQNHYLTTGEVIMMSVEYPKYHNTYKEAANDFSKRNNR
jgi:hypothetical protein